MPSLIEIGSLVLGKKIISMYFHNFYIIFPWKRAESFTGTNLDSIQSVMFCTDFCLKLTQWFLTRCQNVK